MLGGLVPVIVDASTGAWYELDSRVVNANLSAERPATAQNLR